MAKYDVTYSCGHAARIEQFGPEKERTRKREWLERAGSCTACYRKKMQTQEKAKAEAAAIELEYKRIQIEKYNAEKAGN